MIVTRKRLPMSDHLSVSEVSRQIPGSVPRDISKLFYDRQLRDDICPVVAGRRLIPADYIPLIKAALIRAGKIAREELAHA